MLDYDLVIFDCDGVLVDSERISNEAISSLLKEVSLDVSPDEVARRATGLSEADMWQMFEVELGSPLPVDISERHLSIESERFRTELRSMPGVLEAVQHLANAGTPMCVASSGMLEKMARIHMALGRVSEGKKLLARAQAIRSGH